MLVLVLNTKKVKGKMKKVLDKNDHYYEKPPAVWNSAAQKSQFLQGWQTESQYREVLPGSNVDRSPVQDTVNRQSDRRKRQTNFGRAARKKSGGA